MTDRELEAAAIKLAPIRSQLLEDGSIEFLVEIVRTRRDISEFRGKVSKIQLTRTGYSTQTALTRLESDYQVLNDRVEALHNTLVTRQPTEIKSIDSLSVEAQNQLLAFIDEGTVPAEVDRLEQSLMMVGQQLNSKTIAANSRMGITISVVAVLIAASSTVLPILL